MSKDTTISLSWYEEFYPNLPLPTGIHADEYLYIIDEDGNKQYIETIASFLKIIDKINDDQRNKQKEDTFDLPYILYIWVLFNLYFRQFIII